MNGHAARSVGRLLGVGREATQAEVRAAYRAAALRVHPDVSDAPDATAEFAALSNAYGVHSSHQRQRHTLRSL